MTKTTLSIEGMACTMCESHVNEAVRKVVDAKKVTSSFKKGETEILSAAAPDEAALRAAIEATGYKVL
ncbi:MAG: heavy-metal-associated domain-containing protein, partial [bacterium]